MVGWRNYFDLKQAETGAHYVVVMENWRVESLSLSICFLFAKSECRRAGEGWSEAETLSPHSDAAFNRAGWSVKRDDGGEVEGARVKERPVLSNPVRNTLQHKVESYSGSLPLKCQRVDG